MNFLIGTLLALAFASSHLYVRHCDAQSLTTQLLHDIETEKLSSEQASNLYASLVAEGTISEQQRHILITSIASRSKISSSDWPDFWQQQLNPLDPKQKPLVVDASVEKVRDPALVKQRTNRNATLLKSKHFLIEADVDSASFDELSIQCESVFALLQHWFDLPPLANTLSINVMKSEAVYHRLLGRKNRSIAMTNGYFDTQNNIVYCFWADGDRDHLASTAALRHEVTHQVLTNCFTGGIPTRIDWDHQSDFWVFEAIATYVESLRLRNAMSQVMVSVGGWETPRLQAARYRRLHDLSWLPWKEFRSATRREFQDPQDIQLRYSQATGLAHYFLDNDPQLAKRFVAYVVSVHRGKPNEALLGLKPPAAAGDPDADLRASYDQFLLASPEFFAAYPLQPPQMDMVLSRCAVDDATLRSWPASHRKFDWLDFSFTKISGESFAPTSPAWSARRLNLESTGIGDEDLPNLLRVNSLEELDLSNCPITDTQLSKLAKIDSLKRLWLTGTQVTDEGLKQLSSLDKLEFLDVSETKISQSAWQNFRQKHPRLK